MRAALEQFPVCRFLENGDVRFAGSGGHRFPPQLSRDNAVVEFSLHRNRCNHVTVHEVLGLAMLPTLRVNGERAGAQRIPIELTERLNSTSRSAARPGCESCSAAFADPALASAIAPAKATNFQRHRDLTDCLMMPGRDYGVDLTPVGVFGTTTDGGFSDGGVKPRSTLCA